MIDNKKRSILKTSTWRVLASMITMLIVYFYTGEIEISVGVGLVEVVVKFLIYYFHERIWDRINWGREG